MVSPSRAPGPLPSLDDPTPVESTGTGTLAGARGAFAVVGDLDGDGTAEPLSGEVDVLGNKWVADEFMGTPWTADSWERSPWAPLVAEIQGSATAPAATGPVAPRVAWDPQYWGATSPQEAGWDARYWGARYWGARYWGTDAWK
jgi:hypothetical protein